MSVPASANTDKTIKQVHDARSAMWRRRGRSEWPVMARKVGTAAIGSTRTKIDVNATRENWRRGDTSSSYLQARAYKFLRRFASARFDKFAYRFRCYRLTDSDLVGRRLFQY